MFVARPQCCMEEAMPAKFRRDNTGLVNSARPWAVQIELLQSDHVDAEHRDDFCDPLFRTPPIYSKTPVDIVGRHSEGLFIAHQLSLEYTRAFNSLTCTTFVEQDLFLFRP